MKKNGFFEPDYRNLNRTAKQNKGLPGSKKKNGILDWLKGGSAEDTPEPVMLERLANAIADIKAKINWEQDLATASYAVFDTETTGLHPFRGDEIISIGAVLVNQGCLAAEPTFYRLVNPRRPVSPASQRITGLNNKMLEDKPVLEEVLIDFLAFTGPRILVAHNAPFDLAFLNNRITRLVGERIVNPVIDTVLLTSALFYPLGDFSLENLANHFALDLTERHNALGDARIAATLFLKLLPVLKEKGITTLPRLAGLFVDADPSSGYPLIF